MPAITSEKTVKRIFNQSPKLRRACKYLTRRFLSLPTPPESVNQDLSDFSCYSRGLRIALLGYGHVGKAFARLLERRRSAYPFRIVGIHTAHHGSAYDDRGLPVKPSYESASPSVDEFLDRSRPEVLIEVTTLNPVDGEPATSHIRTAFARGLHVITANKGPIAHAYRSLIAEARARQVEFRFESTVMDGTPLFNQFRNNLPGVKLLGFAGVLNSTTKVVLAAMERGLSMADGVHEAQQMGITEADAHYDLEGWDSAAKAAAIANVLMHADARPQQVRRQGIVDLTVAEVIAAAAERKSYVLVSRGELMDDTVQLQVGPELVSESDLLTTPRGTSNVILLYTDLMGTLATVSLDPGVEQTAYGLFADLVDIARSV